MNVSLDGYVEAPGHGLDWPTMDEEVHTWFNEHHRALDASLYGRRLYELMSAYWPTAEADPEATPVMREYSRIWSATPRIVFSTTLDEVGFNSRLVRGDPERVLETVQTEFPGDLEVGGATLAAEFVRRDLVDVYQLMVHPVILGAGTPFFPSLEQPIKLRLTQTHAFGSGVTLIEYERA
jgi:dihydrofolate reductase